MSPTGCTERCRRGRISKPVVRRRGLCAAAGRLRYWTSKHQFPKWRDAIIRADGLVIVAPEYNHGYPGALKSVLDLLLKEYVHKAVALVGVSAGAWGGTRVIEAMVPMVRELGLAVTFTDLHFPTVQSKFDDSGKLLDDAYAQAASMGFLTRSYG